MAALFTQCAIPLLNTTFQSLKVSIPPSSNTVLKQLILSRTLSRRVNFITTAYSSSQKEGNTDSLHDAFTV